MLEIGLAAAFVALTVTRKDGIGGVSRKLREALPGCRPLHCSFCCAFWFSILVSLGRKPDATGFFEGLASAGLAAVCLALCGALDLDR